MDNELRINCFKALACLYIAVEAPIAADINAKIKAYIAVEEAKVAKLEGWLKLLYYHHCDDIETDKTLQEISDYIKEIPKD